MSFRQLTCPSVWPLLWREHPASSTSYSNPGKNKTSCDLSQKRTFLRQYPPWRTRLTAREPRAACAQAPPDPGTSRPDEGEERHEPSRGNDGLRAGRRLVPEAAPPPARPK